MKNKRLLRLPPRLVQDEYDMAELELIKALLKKEKQSLANNNEAEAITATYQRAARLLKRLADQINRELIYCGCRSYHI
ncbi:MAG TPA: hypothetical protein VEA59_03660 [Patescibacteria group bacterium]|nr:hypothetical protein [Patescibacteria group bacterium]